MKQQLTVEQSSELIKRGIARSKASEFSQWEQHGSLIFTLSDLLEILPKSIRNSIPWIYGLNISWHDNKWNVVYITWFDTTRYNVIHACSSVELIDALYQFVVWCLDNGYINKT